MQRAPNSQYVFTDAQYNLFEKMKDSNHYSFSGSTSFGKSFIFESFINYIIDERNASDNIAILVPTRALINQVSLKLKAEIQNENYKIISHPKIPLLYRKKEHKFLLVMTAERLISYFSDVNNPPINYLFVDEAHKLLNEKDPRTPLLYHALVLAKRKSVKLYFASPNIPNTDIFLKLLGNSTDENSSIKESPVSQNRFFIDCIEGKAMMFSDFGDDIPLPNFRYSGNEIDNFFEIVSILGAKNQNIVYCNTIAHTIELAKDFSNRLANKNSPEIDELIKLIEDSVHEQYFLIDCLKKGVAFHYGKIPQRIREKIEDLFRSGKIDFLFCTSTLLEGVNLPAKNIFILSSKIGRSNMDDVNFWNLAGRAGRLTKDLSGNIFCVRVFDKEGYWKKQKEVDIIRKRKVSIVESRLMKKNDGNFFKNISNSLNNLPFTNKRLSTDIRKSISMYGNILVYHEMVKSDSILHNRFLEKNTDGRETLKKLTSKIEVPEHIISQSTNIGVRIQNSIFSKSMIGLPLETDYLSCLKMLNILSDSYEWGNEEKDFISNQGQLKYYAVLIHSWVNSKPLKYIILNTIRYYNETKRNLFIQGNQYVRFDKDNPIHINILINQLISDIENVIRFKIKNYVNNYILLLEEKGHKTEANWSDFLEYGTTDSLIIEIQNLGFPRHLATFLKENHSDCFVLEDDSIVDFSEKKLKKEIDRKKYSNEFKELKELFEW